MQEKKQKLTDPPHPPSLPTWWETLLSFLGIGNGKDREKLLILKNIRNTLKQTGKKYFQVGVDMAEPALAKIFYDIYVTLGPAQSLLVNLQTSGALKTIVIEGGLSETVLGLARSLDDDSIQKRAKEIPHSQLTEELHQVYGNYYGAFTSEVTKKIESQYNLILLFLELLKINYYFLLKKFDSNLAERDLTHSPRFEKINGTYIVDDLKEFWEMGSHVPIQADWESVFDALKAYKNMDPVNRNSWKRVLQHLSNLQRSDLLPLIIQHVSQDPAYQVLSKPPKESLVEAHLGTVKTRYEMLLGKLKTENRMSAISKLAREVFGTEGVSRTKFYTEKANTAFSRKMLGGYLYVESINYLKAFLIDFCKKDLRELFNYLVVKGQWFNQELSKPFADSIHRLMEISERLIQFDESLSEESERGAKLKSHLIKSDRDSNAMSIVKTLLRDINALAKTFLVETGNELIVVGKNLKAVLEDFPKVKHEVIMNWKNLETGTIPELKERMLAVYKKIFNFVQLLQFYMKES